MPANPPSARSFVPVHEPHGAAAPGAPPLLDRDVVLALCPAGQLVVGLPARRALCVLAADGALVPWCAPTGKPAQAARPVALGGIAVMADGAVWLTDVANHRLVRLDAEGRRLVPVAGGRAGRVDGPAGEARLRGPGLLAAALPGSPGSPAVVVEEGTRHLRRVGPDGAVTTLAPYAPAADPATRHERSPGDPRGLAWDAAGRLLIYDAGMRAVYRLDAAGAAEALGRLPDPPFRWRPEKTADEGFEDPRLDAIRAIDAARLVVDPAGHAYVADDRSHRIFKLDGAGGCAVLAGRPGPGLADRRGALARFDRPAALAMRPDGVLVVADAGNHRLRLVHPDGRVETLAGGEAGEADGPADQARFLAPGPLAIAPDGTLWLVDAGCRVCRIDAAGAVTTAYRAAPAVDRLRGGPEPRFDGPLRLAAAPDGGLYVLEPRHNRIRRVDAAGRPTTLLWWQPSRGTRDPHGIALDDLAVDAAGNLFAIDGWSGAILAIDPAGAVRTVGRHPRGRGSRMPGVDHDRAYAMEARREGLRLACDPAGGFVVEDRPAARFGPIPDPERGYLGPDGMPYRHYLSVGRTPDPAGGWWSADLKHQALVAFAADLPADGVVAEPPPGPRLRRPEDLVGATLHGLRPAAGARYLASDAGWAPIQEDVVACPCCYGFRIMQDPGTDAARSLTSADWPPMRIEALSLSYDAGDPRPHLHGLSCAERIQVQLPGRLDVASTASPSPAWAALAGWQIEAVATEPDGVLLVRCYEGDVRLPLAAPAAAVEWRAHDAVTHAWRPVPAPSLAGAAIGEVTVRLELVAGGTATLFLQLDDGRDVTPWVGNARARFRLDPP